MINSAIYEEAIERINMLLIENSKLKLKVDLQLGIISELGKALKAKEDYIKRMGFRNRTII